MPWWCWIALGALLLGAEAVVTTDFFLVFFGLASLAIGLMLLLGIHAPVWVQWLAFAALSVVSVMILRPRLRHALSRQHGPEGTDLIGETVTLQADLPSNAVGRGDLRGSVWNVRNVGDRPLRSGERCTVRATEGVTLLVRGEG